MGMSSWGTAMLPPCCADLSCNVTANLFLPDPVQCSQYLLSAVPPCLVTGHAGIKAAPSTMDPTTPLAGLPAPPPLSLSPPCSCPAAGANARLRLPPLPVSSRLHASASPLHLPSPPHAAALQRAHLPASAVDEVFMGNVCSSNLGQAPATQAAVRAGLPDTVPCTGINKVHEEDERGRDMGAALRAGLPDTVPCSSIN